MTAAEAAKKLEISVNTVYEMCSKGVLGHQRVGVGRGSIRINPDDLENYLASRRVEARGAARPRTADGTGLAVKDYFPEL